MPDQDPILGTMLKHIRHLSLTIGGRGSCTESEALAAEYLASEMEALGLHEVRLERFKGAPSTYRPYALAFAIAFLGTVLVWFSADRWAYAIATLLSVLGAWGIFSEMDFTPNWMRLLLPKGDSQNAIGLISPQDEIRRQVVLSAHFDTHRTPIFYSSRRWQKLFSLLIGGAFASTLFSTLLYGAGAIFNWEWVRWPALIVAAMQVFALTMTIHADLTPFSPGANDDASGIGVTLAIAEQLRSQPLKHTQVWLVFTDCEEAASYGILDFIRRHAGDLGNDTIYIVNDQVAAGCLNYILSDGLIRKYPAHPDALALARQARQELPQVQVKEANGAAYTDATSATKLGYKAITLVANPLPGSDTSTHWHQMSDTFENLDEHTLKDAFTFTYQLLQIIDRKAGNIEIHNIPQEVKPHE